MKRFITLLSILVTGLSSCYYDVEQELYGSVASGPCDTANVSYTAVINPMLNANGCFSCHSSSAPLGNVILDNYAGVKAKVTDGRLIGAINHAPGFSAMPQGGNKLSPCEIKKIESWVAAGAPQN